MFASSSSGVPLTGASIENRFHLAFRECDFEVAEILLQAINQHLVALPAPTLSPWQNRCGSRMAMSAEKLLEWPL